jgi:hypothetical protein
MIASSNLRWYIRAMMQEPTTDPIVPSRPTIAHLIARLAEHPRPTEVETRDVDLIPGRPGL